MKFGGIELGGIFGGYEIVNMAATKLPQELATAIGEINSGLLGATFQPIWYVGKQVVNGVNHLLICEEIRSTKDRSAGIVALVINIPPGSVGGKGAKVAEIIDEAKLEENIRVAFDSAVKSIVGVGYKAVAYVGSQVVRGTNHYFVCEARGIYPDAKPYAALVCVNVFEGATSLVSISPIGGGSEKAGLFGYAFTW